MTNASRFSRSAGTVWVRCVLIVLLGAGASQAKDDKWLDELNRLERQADQGRKAFWCGQYEEAEQQFSSLADSVHPSVILYLNESAMCKLAQGDYEGTEQRLRQVDLLLNTYYDAEREEQALSAFGAEAEKIYRGDPYEQTAAYMLLALIYLDRGDYDNALAACKSGILADSDASENLFDSDVALLHVLEAKCYQFRGEEESFQSCRQAAIKSVQLTSAQVRELFSQRLDLLELLKMSRKERKSLGEGRKDDEIQADIQQLTTEIDREMASVNAMELLGPLYSGEFNVLVLVPRGRCAEKTRAGSETEMVVFRRNEIPCQCPSIQLDGQVLDPQGSLATSVDLDFQAMTRGGRRMDAILRGKAVSRKTTRNVGKVITDAGSNIGGLVGLGVALTGAIVQGAAGAMTAESDTRCWGTLPREFQIYALDLPPGDHEISGSHYVYFRKTDAFHRKFTLAGDRDMAVVVAPPVPYELYFRRSELKLSKRDRAGLENSSTILIPPPTGLDDIIRVNTSSSEAKLEAIAPDPKRIMRVIHKSLRVNQIPSALLCHDEIIQSRRSLVEDHDRVLQCRFVEIAREGGEKSGAYRLRLVFSLVDAKTGSVLARETTEGVSADLESGPTTAFYACVQKATEAFLQNGNAKDFGGKK